MGNIRRLNPFTANNELSKLSATISVRFCESEAFITISVPKRKGLWPAIMLVLQQCDFQVLNATRSSNKGSDFHCIHAQIPEDSDIDSDDLYRSFELLIFEELGIQACRS